LRLLMVQRRRLGRLDRLERERGRPGRVASGVEILPLFNGIIV
jgi:hypothetical protein